MPQLIFFALVGAVAYFGYTSFVREAEARHRQGAARREAGRERRQRHAGQGSRRPANTGSPRTDHEPLVLERRYRRGR